MGAGKDTLTYRGKTLVRTIGTVLIVACCLMVVLGSTLWSDQLQGPRYVLYWSWCFLIAAAALFVALVDLMMIRRASQQTRRQLFRDQFHDR